MQFKPVVDRHEVGIFADGDFTFILEAEEVGDVFGENGKGGRKVAAFRFDRIAELGHQRGLIADTDADIVAVIIKKRHRTVAVRTHQDVRHVATLID